MTKQLRNLLLALTCLIACAMPASADEIVINVDRDWPPYTYDDNGVAKGILCNIIKQVFTELGHKIKIDPLPWKRVIKELDEARAGAGGLYRTEPRIKKYDFSAPIYVNKLAVFTRKGSDLKIKKLEDLKDLKVGTVHGWSYPKNVTKALESNLFNSIRARSEKINLKWLAKGRLDAAIAVLESVNSSAREWGLTDQIEPAAILKVTNIYVAFNKKAGKKELLKEFDKAFLKLKEAGALKDIGK